MSFSGVLTKLRWLGPVSPICQFFCLFIGLFFCVRIILLIVFSAQLQEPLTDLMLAFVFGLKTDISVLCAITIIPCLVLLILPKQATHYMRYVFVGFFCLFGCALLFLEIVSGPFLEEYGVRPNQMLIEPLTHPQEVISMVWSSYRLTTISGVIGIGLFAYVFWRISMTQFSSVQHWPYLVRLVVMPLLVVMMLVGMRSSFDRIPPNPSMMMFSNNQMLNQITLNAAYSLFFAIYRGIENTIESETLYGSLPIADIFERVKSNMHISQDKFLSSTLPSLHRQQSYQPKSQPNNLVIILMEGMGAEFMASLGGVPVTPNLERLAKQGIFFTQLYSIGTRTSRGIEALVSGFLPTTQYGSILKLPGSQYKFFTIAALLKQHQYQTTFIYGGEAHFDNMSGFVLGNGFDQVIDLDDFPHQSQKSTWGVVDEDMLIYANQQLRQMRAPFLSLILTLSNHKPYDIPDSKITPYEQPKSTANNAAMYADFALGRFFELAAKEAYFHHTIFILIADHPMQVAGKDLVPIHQFHIPGIILGPGIEKQRYTKLMSQIDILPTALPFLGLDLIHPMVGRNVLTLPDNVLGRAVMQYNNNNAYWVGDKVIIHQPHKPAKQFRLDNGRLVAMSITPELRQDALAHILFPSVVYKQNQYRLPVQ